MTKPVTAGLLRKVIPTLDDRQFRMMCGSTLPSKPDKPGDLVTPTCKLLAYLYEWIQHWGLFESGQIERILQRFYDELDETEASKTPATFSIVDKRYVVWEGRKIFYDSELNRDYMQLPKTPVTYMTCHVQALVHEKEVWLQRLMDGR